MCERVLLLVLSFFCCLCTGTPRRRLTGQTVTRSRLGCTALAVSGHAARTSRPTRGMTEAPSTAGPAGAAPSAARASEVPSAAPEDEPPPTLDTILAIEDLRDRVLFHVPPSTLCTVISHAFAAACRREEYWTPWLEDALSPAYPRGEILAWRSNWYCYWSGDFAMPSNPEADYVFRPPLEQTIDGVVRPHSWEDFAAGPPAREVCRELRSLLAWRGGLCEVGWGDEGGGLWTPLLVPWTPSDGELTPEALLRKLGAHPQLLSAIQEREEGVLDEEDAEDEEGEENRYAQAARRRRAFRSALQQKLDAHASVIFTAGSEKLNPVPCFAVAQARLSPTTSAQRLAALPHLPPRAAAAGAPRPRLGLRRRRRAHLAISFFDHSSRK